MPITHRQIEIPPHARSTNEGLANYVHDHYFNRQLDGGDLVTDGTRILLGEGGLATAVVLSDGNEKVVASTIVIPEFWLDGVLVLTTYYSANAAPTGGNEDVRLKRTLTTHGEGDDIVSEGSQILSTETTVTLTDNDLTTLVDTTIIRLTATAHILTVSLIRSPGNAADNYTSDLYIHGFNIEYYPQFPQ